MKARPTTVQLACTDVVVHLPEHHGDVHTCGDVGPAWDVMVAEAERLAGAPVAHMGTTIGVHLFKVLS